MKHIFTKYDGGSEGVHDSNLSAYMHDDGSLMIKVPLDGMAPFLAERHITAFVDALRRAYAERYDKVFSRRNEATKETFR